MFKLIGLGTVIYGGSRLCETANDFFMSNPASNKWREQFSKLPQFKLPSLRRFVGDSDRDIAMDSIIANNAAQRLKTDSEYQKQFATGLQRKVKSLIDSPTYLSGAFGMRSRMNQLERQEESFSKLPDEFKTGAGKEIPAMITSAKEDLAKQMQVNKQLTSKLRQQHVVDYEIDLLTGR